MTQRCFSDALQEFPTRISKLNVVFQTSDKTCLTVIANPSYGTDLIHITLGVLLGRLDRMIWEFLNSEISQAYATLVDNNNFPPILKTDAHRVDWNLPSRIVLDGFKLEQFLSEKAQHPNDAVMLGLDLNLYCELLVCEKSPILWPAANPLALYCMYHTLRTIVDPAQVCTALVSLPEDKQRLAQTFTLGHTGMDLVEVEARLDAWLANAFDPSTSWAVAQHV